MRRAEGRKHGGDREGCAIRTAFRWSHFMGALQSDDLKKLLALAEYPRVYVKISHLWSLSKEKYPYKDTHDQVKRLYDKFDVKRLMRETDWLMVE